MLTDTIHNMWRAEEVFMAERETAPTQTTHNSEPILTNIKDKERHWGTRVVFFLGTVAVTAGMSAGALHGAGEAKADNQLAFGGRYDVNSQELVKHLIETHQVNPATDQIFAVQSPGGMIEQLDGTSMVDTVKVMVSDADNILKTKIDPNEKTNLWSYSLGTAGALLTADKHEDIVDSVTADKSWVGPGGLADSELAKRPDIKGMLDENKIIIDVPIPTDIPVKFISNTDDAISGGAKLEEVGEVISVGMSSFEGPHDMADPAKQPREVQHFGNVTVEWFGDSPIPTFTFDPIKLPSVEELLAPLQPPVSETPAPEPAQVPEATVLVDAVAPAPDAAPAPEAPAPEVLEQAAAPVPEVEPEIAPEVVPAPAPEAMTDLGSDVATDLVPDNQQDLGLVG